MMHRADTEPEVLVMAAHPDASAWGKASSKLKSLTLAVMMISGESAFGTYPS